MLQAPGDATRWFVVEQGGTVRVFDNQPAVATSRSFVDITARVRSGGEQGLLGMAFPSRFPTDPRVYLSYTNATSGLVSRVSEFRTRDGGQTLDPASEVILLTVAQPATNHNGGNIAFGPDGFLYIGLGDGGSGGDPWGTIGNGQNLTTTARQDAAHRRQRHRPATCRTASRPAIRMPATRCATAAPARRTARRSTPTACAIRGAGASIAAAANCGSPTSARARWRKSIASCPAATTAGAASKAPVPTTRPAARTPRAACRPSRSTTTRSASPSPAATSIAAARCPALAGRYVFGDFGSGRIWHIARDTAPTLQRHHGLRHRPVHRLVRAGQRRRALRRALRRHAAPAAPRHRRRRHRFPTQLSATGCVAAGRCRRKPAAGLHPVRAQRAVLVGRRRQGALAGAAGRRDASRRRPTATSTSRTAPCW